MLNRVMTHGPIIIIIESTEIMLWLRLRHCPAGLECAVNIMAGRTYLPHPDGDLHNNIYLLCNITYIIENYPHQV